ncbi:hypothetical protein FNV43_RR27358 [Rhamnella rubrinervis]|uniref:Uncharacterized protein n=1 Tax=Rhamnella rubrinervis TaxID=2594499 RepID=A0A8K0DR24_9ROSA|nr:hypothetical protein FNV43_RR27358 [Rhamnella rubrinervis]
MSVIEYEKKFLELPEFYPYLIPNEKKKERMFLDRLNNAITIGIYEVVHPLYQSLKDAALKVEQQRMMCGLTYSPFEGNSLVLPIRDLQKGKVVVHDLQAMEDLEDAYQIQVFNRDRRSGHFRKECHFLIHGSIETLEFGSRAFRIGFHPQHVNGDRG